MFDNTSRKRTILSRVRNPRVRSDEGSSTVEYAIIVVVAAAFAGLLLKAVTSPEVYDRLFNLVLRSIA